MKILNETDKLQFSELNKYEVVELFWIFEM